MPRVIPEVEEATAVPSWSQPRTIRPYKWHVTGGGHTVKKEFQRTG